MKVNRPAEALPNYDKLIKEFEKSQYLEEAKKRVAEIKAAPASPAKATTPKGGM